MVRVDATADKKVLYMAGAKGMGWFQAHGIAKTELRPERGPSLRIYHQSATEGARWRELAKFDKGLWTVQSALFHELLPDTDATEAALKAAAC